MAEMMKAVTIVDVGKAELREYPKPVPGKHEVLVHMKACALCTVDQRAFLGVTKNHLPSVQGHEGSGIVEAVGEDVHFIHVGDHVVLEREFCGVCHYCKENINQCTGRAERRKEFEAAWKPGELAKPIGGFESQMAQYLTIQENKLTVVDPAIPCERAAVTEPVSCVIHGVNRSRLATGEVAVIIGAGIMGLLHVQIAKLKGATVIMSEPDAARREKALAAGADFVVDPTAEDLKTFVEAHSYGRGGADVVFSTVPHSSLFEQGMGVLARAGRIVAYSSQHPDVPVSVSIGQIHSREIEIIGTMGSNREETYLATQLIARGYINTDLVIDHVLPAERCQEAFEKATTPGTYRVVMQME